MAPNATEGSDTVADRLERVRIVPVLTIEEPGSAGDIVAALVEGGIPCAEITLRTQGGLKALRAAASCSKALVGAGTVTHPEQVERARDAGAAFIVSPGLSLGVVERAQELGIPVFPGVATATEVQLAMRSGLTCLKLFPAGVLGGPALIEALSGPFPQVRFIPTGGITASTAADYLRLPSVLAVGGSWMAPSTVISAGRFDEVRALASAAISALGTTK